jgi:hypothetical protein
LGGRRGRLFDLERCHATVSGVSDILRVGDVLGGDGLRILRCEGIEILFSEIRPGIDLVREYQREVDPYLKVLCDLLEVRPEFVDVVDPEAVTEEDLGLLMTGADLDGSADRPAAKGGWSDGGTPAGDRGDES